MSLNRVSAPVDSSCYRSLLRPQTRAALDARTVRPKGAPPLPASLARAGERFRPIDGHKACTKCLKVLQLSEFYVRPTGKPMTCCKKCHKAACAAYKRRRAEAYQ